VAEHPSEERDLPVLIVIEGAQRGQQWTLRGSETVIGRGSDCDIVLPERRISREHFRIWRDRGIYFIEDLQSKNGTFVDGERVESARELREGDEIQVALSAKLKFLGSEATIPLTFDDYDIGEIGLVLDTHTRQVTINGEALDPQLSLYQYRLLELLYENEGGVCTRDDVVQAVWPEAVEAGVSEQAIDALVRRLRDRLAEISPQHQYIVTVRGHGFRLEQPGIPGM
jgi:hypothetical protein